MPKETFFNLSQEKQEKVIRSAVSEFLKHGFDKGNVGDIAKSAGVAKGSMYQYFENKKELFLYSVSWSTEVFMKKYRKDELPGKTDIFEWFYQSASHMLHELKDEKELAIFIQEVFLGKHGSMTDESITAMLKAGDGYVMKLVQDGKKNGSIRKDIDDRILTLFMIGASMKIKENILIKARDEGNDIFEDYEMYEKDIKAMLELLKNGMGAKSCS